MSELLRSHSEIIVFAGPTSQTGQAFAAEYSDAASFDGRTFPEVSAGIRDMSIPATVLPMWNTHFGEIYDAHTLDHIFNQRMRIAHLWPKQILFPLWRGTNRSGNSLISVTVAERQCSIEISRQGLAFQAAASTRHALEIFNSTPSINYALLAPGQTPDQALLTSEDAANPVNLTTFAYMETAAETRNIVTWYSGLIFPRNFWDDAASVERILEGLFVEASANIEVIPNLLFVTDRKDGNSGILFASAQPLPTIRITVPDSRGSIQQIDAGTDDEPYEHRISEHIAAFRPRNADFLCLTESDSCLFACPPLGLFTHGYNRSIVESAFRTYIGFLFDLFLKGRLPSHSRFFKKHIKKYRDEGKDFIHFAPLQY